MKIPFLGDDVDVHYHYSRHNFLMNCLYDSRTLFQMNTARADTCFLCRVGKEDDISDDIGFLHNVMMPLFYDYCLIFKNLLIKVYHNLHTFFSASLTLLKITAFTELFALKYNPLVL